MDSRAIKDFYRAAFKEYGDTPEGMRWGDRETHYRRLMRLHHLIVALDIQWNSVLDVGCGTGMLHDLWAMSYKDAAYIGVDLVPEYVAVAASVTASNPKAMVLCDDFLTLPLDHPFSVTVAVGTFAWVDIDIVRKMLSKMWDLTAEGGVMAFTYLPDNPLSNHELRHMKVLYQAEEVLIYDGYSKRLNEHMVIMKKGKGSGIVSEYYKHREEIEQEVLNGEHRDADDDDD